MDFYPTLIEHAPTMMMVVLGSTALAFMYFVVGLARCCILKRLGKCPTDGCNC